jgi:hypothetical protein
MPRDIDGSNYYTMADDAAWDDIPYVTSAAWVRNDGVADWQPLLLQRFRDDVNGRFWGCVFVGAGANLRHDTSPDGTFYAGNYNEYAHGMSNNVWYHVALVSGPSNNRLYRNGTLLGTDSAITPGIGDGTDALRLGHSLSYAGAARGGNSKYADVCLWRAALTTEEILGLAKGAPPGSVRPTEYIGHWPLWGLATREVNLARSVLQAVPTGTPAAYTTTQPPVPPPVSIHY